MVTCPRCKGKGTISWAGSTMEPTCPRCEGRGTVPPYDSPGGRKYPAGTTVTTKVTRRY